MLATRRIVVTIATLGLLLLITSSEALSLKSRNLHGPQIVQLTKVLSEGDAKTCGGSYDNAECTLIIRQGSGRTAMILEVENARPNTGYTIWIKLDQTSPITGLPFTACANTADLPGLVAITPDTDLISHELGMGDDGTGATSAANGFYTDENGNARFKIILDLPLVKGAYPFQEMVSAPPAALGDFPFIIGIVSHCTDNRLHGLSTGVFEFWWMLVTSPFAE
jgi:hypothetical protein